MKKICIIALSLIICTVNQQLNAQDNGVSIEFGGVPYRPTALHALGAFMGIQGIVGFVHDKAQGQKFDWAGYFATNAIVCSALTAGFFATDGFKDEATKAAATLCAALVAPAWLLTGLAMDNPEYDRRKNIITSSAALATVPSLCVLAWLGLQ